MTVETAVSTYTSETDPRLSMDATRTPEDPCMSNQFQEWPLHKNIKNKTMLLFFFSSDHFVTPFLNYMQGCASLEIYISLYFNTDLGNGN